MKLLATSVLSYGGLTAASLLGALAARFAALGHTIRGQELIDEAEHRLTSSPADEWVRALITGEIVVRRVQVQGYSALPEALRRILELKDDPLSYSLTWLIKVLAGAGERQGLRDVLAVVQRIREEERSEVLGELAATFLSADMSADVDAVMQLAEETSGREPRLKAISSVALSLASAGRQENASRAVNSIVETAARRSFSDREENQKVRALTELSTALESCGLHDAAREALVQAESTSNAAWTYSRAQLAVAAARIRGRDQAVGLLNSILEGIRGSEPHHWGFWSPVDQLAGAMAAVRFEEGIPRLRQISSSIDYPFDRARNLVAIGSLSAKLQRVAEASSVLNEAVDLLERDDGSPAAESNRASSLERWFDGVREAGVEAPELLVDLVGLGTIDRAITAADGIRDEGWNAQVLGAAARLLTHIGQPQMAEKICSKLDATHPDISARIWVDQARVGTARGDARVSANALDAAIAASKRAITGRNDQEQPLSSVAEICGEAGDADSLRRVTEIASRLESEAHALFLFTAAAALLKLGQKESTRSALDDGIRRALAVEAKLTLKQPKDIGWRIRETLTTIAQPGDTQVSSWIGDLFEVALRQGRESVLALVATLAPVLAQLGIIADLWDHWNRVESLVVGR